MLQLAVPSLQTWQGATYYSPHIVFRRAMESSLVMSSNPSITSLCSRGMPLALLSCPPRTRKTLDTAPCHGRRQAWCLSACEASFAPVESSVISASSICFPLWFRYRMPKSIIGGIVSLFVRGKVIRLEGHQYFEERGRGVSPRKKQHLLQGEACYGNDCRKRRSHLRGQ